MWLRDTGILDKLKYDNMKRSIPIPLPILRHKQPLILRQLAIIMITLIVGLSIAILVFFIEICKRPKTRNVFKSADKIELPQGHATDVPPMSGLTPVIIE